MKKPLRQKIKEKPIKPKMITTIVPVPGRFDPMHKLNEKILKRIG